MLDIVLQIPEIGVKAFSIGIWLHELVEEVILDLAVTPYLLKLAFFVTL